MAEPLTCEDMMLTPEQIERGKMMLLDDGTYARRVVITDQEPDALSCDNIEGVDSMILRRTVKVGPGEFADLVYEP